MKKIFLTILFIVITVLAARDVSASTEFIAIVDPDSGPGTSFTTLDAWETAVQCDLTATTTLVFSYSTASGTVADGASVTGATSGATATAEHTTSGQILLTAVASGPFQSGEQIYQTQDVHYVVISDAGDSVIATAKCRSTAGSADTTNVTVDGWTTATSTYIKIWTDPDDPYGRHNGKWSTAKYRLSASNDNILKIEEAYVRVDGLQIEVTAINGADECGINVDLSTPGGGGEWQVSNNIIKGVNGGSQNYHDGLRFVNMTATATAKVWNNIVYDFDSNDNSVGMDFYDDDLTVYAYNNTVNNCDSGYLIYAGTATVRNNIANDITLAGYDFRTSTGGTWHSLSGNNISSDWSAPGDSSMTTTTVDFVSTSTEDYHLSIIDTSARKNGTTSVDSLFTTDIDGETRSGLFDIGADEIVYTAYRSVGNTEADLKTSASTVTVSTYAGTSTAVFSVGQPDNVGVGDVIQYGGSGYYALAYIIGRTSSSTFSIQGGYNNLPTATSSAACSIYRAFELLDDWEDHLEEDVNSSINSSVDEDVLIGLDLVASNTLMFVPCYASTTAADNAAVVVGGWTTGSGNYIKVYTPVYTWEVGETQRHAGKWDDNKYVFQSNNADYPFNIDVDNVIIDGIQLYQNRNDGGHGIVFDASNNTTISNNIFKSDNQANDTAINCGSSAGTGNRYIYNNIAYGFNLGIYLRSNANAHGYIYNNTVYGNNNGIRCRDDYVTARNNITNNNTTSDFYNSTCDSDSGNNISSDWTAPGDNSLTTTTVTFVDSANKDFHLAPTSAGIDQGTSSVSSVVTDDIDGWIRPPGGDAGANTWDIGADEASVYFEPKVVDQSGSTAGEFSSLSSWETGVQCDLTATTTLVFSISTSTGWIPIGSSVYGTTSFAVASTTIVATSSNQILLYNIASSTFQNGEWVCLEGATSNCVRLSNAGNPAIAVAKIDGAWSSADTSAVDIEGWTTGEYNYIRVYTTDSARHQGKWSDSKYVFKSNNNSRPFDINNDSVIIDGIQLYQDRNSGGYGFVFDGSSNITISNNIVRSDNQANAYAISRGGLAGTDHYYVYNNIVYGFDTGIFMRSNTNSHGYIYNNTVYDNNYGYYCEDGYVFMRNNIANINTSLDFYDNGCNSASGYNISSDWTAPGSNSKTTTTVTFLDSTNNDFHLDTDDTAARDAGVALWYNATTSFSTDIDGTSRGGAWDIGADEVPVEYVSTICEGTGTGGDCANLDYHTLSVWEAAVDSDITASTTRVFSGYATGDITADLAVTLVLPNYATTSVTATVVATTSDQILIDNISGTTTPVIAATSSKWCNDTTACAIAWNIGGTGDELGASPIAIAKIDGSWSASDTAAVDIGNWTTDYDNYIKIYTASAARHEGKWDYTAYRMFIDDTSTIVIRTYEEYTRIDGLQFKHKRSGSVYPNILSSNIDNVDSDIHYSNNILLADYSGLTNQGRGIQNSYQDYGNFRIWNNIFYDFVDGDGADTAIYIDSYATAYVYNNTIYNADNGIYSNSSGASTIAINNLIASTTNPFSGAFAYGTDYNSTDHIDDSPGQGDNNRVNQTFSFVSTSTKDFHLAQDDTGAKDFGFDITSSSTLNVISGISTDIDGWTRPYNGTWDIGADEYSMAVIYRSVGPGSTGAKSCAATGGNMSVSSSTSLATFTIGLADTIGVGDAIVYNASSSILFISGRTSSTTYTVKTTAGNNPSDVTADSGWCIFRAYTSLSDAESGQENTGIPDAVENFDDWNPSQADEEGRDLVNNYEQWNIACYGDAVDSTAVTINGWTTGENNYLKIYTPVDTDEVGESQRHTGKWDDDKYRLSSNAINVIYIQDDHVRIDGLQIYQTQTNNNSDGISTWETGVNSSIYISNNIIKGSNPSSAHSYRGIYPRATGAGSIVRIWNNIVYDIGTSDTTRAHGIENGSDWILYVYNNTVYNSDIGYQDNDNGSTQIIINNIAQNCNYGFYASWAFESESDYNISDDWTAPGDNSLTTTTVTFVDEANKDYHLAPTSAGIDQGTSSVASIVTDDIDGWIRPPGGESGASTWDIGADEASVYFEPKVVDQTGSTAGEFSSLSSWETGVQCDLTATTTLVFSIDSSAGWIPIGSSVYGTTSFAVASTTIVSTSSNQILLYNIASSTFQNGEWVCLEGATSNCVRLSNAGNPAIAVAKIDGAWSIVDNPGGTLDINGWTTGEYNYLKIYTTSAARHKGKYNDSYYRFVRTGYGQLIESNESFVRIDGLQFYHNYVSYDGALISLTSVPTGESDVRISNNIIKTDLGDNGEGWAIDCSRQDNNVTKVWNNIIYGFTYDSGTGQNGIGIYANLNVGTAKAYIYNNTTYDCAAGIVPWGSQGTLYLYNNIMQNCCDYSANCACFEGSPSNMVSSNNITADFTSPDSGFGSTTVAFLDSTNNDFHLDPDDTAARDAGVALWYNATTSFSTDIDGTSRGNAWDIGADEVPVEYVSTICENTGTGGDCANLDYHTLSVWESSVDSDITASTTRVFSGYATGDITSDLAVTLVLPNYATTSVTATVVATTSDQILVDNISGTTTPVWAATSSKWCNN
ncbi:right-handed parallel beta-helix repeat-containing protein, partial [Candidatus Parcubacteria bacterium]|nr:right-handed parallel beta-helix repeat-containing protein [Candidatus Parcubacteria bacterium]